MGIYESIILGLIQGLTEFLPVSSSGHLVIAQKLMPGFTQPGVAFDVILHGGTLFSILFFFRKSLVRLGKKYFFAIIIGSIPAVVAGLILESSIEVVFENTTIVGAAFLFTGLLNFLTDKIKAKNMKVNWWKALCIGIAQAVAIVPGISRSGSTIFTGSFLGLKRKKAAEFSFLLSVPVVFGANLLQLGKYTGEIKGSSGIYFVGFLASFLSGYLAIKMVYLALEGKNFKYFSYYLFALGILVLYFF